MHDHEAELEGGFGGALRRLRLAAGLSQEALSERAGLSTDSISALERGVHRAPYRTTVDLLAAGLGLNPQERATLAAAAVRRTIQRKAQAAGRMRGPGSQPLMSG